MSIRKYQDLKLGDRVYMRWRDEGGKPGMSEETTVSCLWVIEDGNYIGRYVNDETGEVEEWVRPLSSMKGIVSAGVGFGNCTELSFADYYAPADRFEVTGHTCWVTILGGKNG